MRAGLRISLPSGNRPIGTVSETHPDSFKATSNVCRKLREFVKAFLELHAFVVLSHPSRNRLLPT